uniref:Uncharacterized protein n=1 Tax=Graphocephala atropunctata TaxID=36148 RepID=A0A1B6LMD2_9HEMI
MASCGNLAPKKCKESRNRLLNQLKSLATELDKGCCDECCRDSPYKRKEKEEMENPCLGVYPRHTADVPHGVNPNRRAHLVDRPLVTVDGRPVSGGPKYQDEEEFDRYPSPPWFKPRSRSQELRAGFFHLGCVCYKRNGLQDDCQRSDCGYEECVHRPPDCEPSTFSPVTGVRIPNMMANEYHNYNRY